MSAASRPTSQQGTFILRASMTPDEVVTALLAPEQIPFVDIALRTGLRLEQITAKLQTLELEMDVREFYELASEPPASLIADYPWLAAIRETAPETASLEGFLWPATYRVRPDTTAEELVRLMLDKFIATVGEERLAVAEERGLTFYQVLTLASIVEREAVLDEERAAHRRCLPEPHRQDPGRPARPAQCRPDQHLGGRHGRASTRLDFDQWQRVRVLDGARKTPMAELGLPEALVGYDTYTQPGLPPGPICTPQLSSIDAALAPRHEGQVHLLPGHPGGRAARTSSPRTWPSTTPIAPSTATTDG